MHFHNMHKYVLYMHKYALYAGICIRINMPLYANLNMHKYAQNMQIKKQKICSDPISISPMHSYAFVCTKYAKICQICKHESHIYAKYAKPCIPHFADVELRILPVHH